MNKSSKDILIELNLKFNKNFEDWQLLNEHNLERSFVSLQCIAAIGEVLQDSKTAAHHDICCKIYDEIFSDGVTSIYLAANAIDKPAYIVLRRVLELGVAAVYLWDMPHMAFSWNHHDHDLSFTEMLTHINSKGYISYVNKELNTHIGGEIIPLRKAQAIYGELSDIVHGKITTFETATPGHFEFIENDWRNFNDKINDVLKLLISALLLRFSIKSEVFAKVPLAKWEFN